MLDLLLCFCIAKKRKTLISVYYSEGLIMGQTLDKLTGCQDDFISLVQLQKFCPCDETWTINKTSVCYVQDMYMNMYVFVRLR